MTAVDMLAAFERGLDRPINLIPLTPEELALSSWCRPEPLFDFSGEYVDLEMDIAVRQMLLDIENEASALVHGVPVVPQQPPFPQANTSAPGLPVVSRQSTLPRGNTSIQQDGSRQAGNLGTFSTHPRDIFSVQSFKIPQPLPISLSIFVSVSVIPLFTVLSRNIRLGINN